MAHVQLRQKDTSMRVLPAYYSGNYVSLLGGEDQEIDITCSADALKGTSPLVMVDGWNVTIDASSSGNVSFRTNEAMVPANSPRTGFTIRADLKQ
jgi:hypothetical protein